MASLRAMQDGGRAARPPWNSSTRSADRTRRLSQDSQPGAASRDSDTPPPTLGSRVVRQTPDKTDRQPPAGEGRASDREWPASQLHGAALSCCGRSEPALATRAQQPVVTIQRWWRACLDGGRCQPLAGRPYCPSRYEDAGWADEAVAPELPGASELSPLEGGPLLQDETLDRAARLRSRLRSLQDLRAKGAGAPAEPAVPCSAATPLQPRGVDRPPSAAVQAQAFNDRPVAASSSSALPSVIGPAEPQHQPPARDKPLVARPPRPHDKLSSILSFLDEVEESSRVDISSLVSSARSTRVPADEGADCADSETASRYKALAWPESRRAAGGGLAHDVAALHSRMSTLELEVQDKRSIIERLKQALSEAHERERQLVQEVAKEWDEKLQKAKSQHETRMERHLKLADQLLNDKTELTRRCELFTEELKAVEKKFQLKIEDMDQQHSKDLAKQKQNWVAAERVRREAWERDKTREIKDMTIKGLEPEVERILSERKQERHLLEERHRDELERQRLELLQQAQVQLQEARQKQLEEQERLLDQEREAHRRKLREEFERFNADVLSERSRCAADLLAERRKHEQERQQAADAAAAAAREAAASERARGAKALEAARQEAAAAEEQFRAEADSLQKRLQAKQQREEQEQRERAQAELEEREAQLREELTAERDRQLETLMERLSREHVEQQRALKEEAASAAERAREDAGEEAKRLAAELAEARAQAAAGEEQRRLLEETVRSMRDRREADVARLDDLGERVKGLEAENAGYRRAAEETLQRHQEELSAAGGARSEELDALRQEVARLAAQVEQERAKNEQQAAEAKQREEQVIGNLEVRVKRTLQAKDDACADLRARCTAAENKAKELEFLLARQREELLSGITQATVRS